jgi:hypothetical protein
MLNLDEIKARAEAATEGPWEYAPVFQFLRSTVKPKGKWAIFCIDTLFTNDADMAFIAHARADVPALIVEVERLQAIVDAVDAALAPHAGDDAQREAWKNYADRGVGVVLESLQ